MAPKKSRFFYWVHSCDTIFYYQKDFLKREMADLGRDTIGIIPSHSRFQLVELSFSQQFSHMYYCRLESLKPSAVQHAKTRLDGNASLTRALDVQKDQSALLIGTAFKHIPTFKGFLKAYTEEQVRILGGEADEEGEDDAIEVDLDQEKDAKAKEPSTIVIEDESGRLLLHGDIPVDRITTGAVIAVTGSLKGGKHFIVDKWCFCGARPQTPLRSLNSNKPRYLAVLSGLQFAAKQNTFEHSNLLDFLTGNSSTNEALQRLGGLIGRVLITGNMIAATENSRLKHKVKLDPSDHIKPADVSNQLSSANAMREVDRFLAQVGSSVHIDVMPGDLDPANSFLPQQPLHPVLLSGSSKMSCTKLVTNPYEFHVEGADLQVFATSGQNVTDVLSQTRNRSTLEVMQDMIDGGNPIPTAPNTLPCYPFRERDPFVFPTTPHIFIAGNQPEVASSLYETVTPEGKPCQTRLVTVPVYAETKSLVLIDLASPTLESEEIYLGL